MTGVVQMGLPARLGLANPRHVPHPACLDWQISGMTAGFGKVEARLGLANPRHDRRIWQSRGSRVEARLGLANPKHDRNPARARTQGWSGGSGVSFLS